MRESVSLPVCHVVDEVAGGVEFSASLDFRTANCTGLLLYTASSTLPDHLGLELVDGVVSQTPHSLVMHLYFFLPLGR